MTVRAVTRVDAIVLDSADFERVASRVSRRCTATSARSSRGSSASRPARDGRGARRAGPRAGPRRAAGRGLCARLQHRLAHARERPAARARRGALPRARGIRRRHSVLAGSTGRSDARGVRRRPGAADPVGRLFARYSTILVLDVPGQAMLRTAVLVDLARPASRVPIRTSWPLACVGRAGDGRGGARLPPTTCPCSTPPTRAACGTACCRTPRSAGKAVGRSRGELTGLDGRGRARVGEHARVRALRGLKGLEQRRHRGRLRGRDERRRAAASLHRWARRPRRGCDPRPIRPADVRFTLPGRGLLSNAGIGRC